MEVAQMGDEVVLDWGRSNKERSSWIWDVFQRKIQCDLATVGNEE